MAQSNLFPAPVYDVQPGDIYQLGRHRLICADATDRSEVARLFAGDKPTMVVTSPPYAKQRDYDRPIACWDSMMLGSLNGHAFSDDVQMLINLGPIHSGGEWHPYWENWLKLMRENGWRIYNQLIWDKISALPGINHGRARPCHEYIFHVNKKSILLNKTEKCKNFNKDIYRQAGMRHRNGVRDQNIKHVGKCIQSHRILDSIVRMAADKCNRTGHPAVFPLSLPIKLISAWKTKSAIVYDCFAGSGTTILAAEAEDVTGLGCEISPAYVAIALARWNKAYPHMPAIRVGP